MHGVKILFQNGEIERGKEPYLWYIYGIFCSYLPNTWNYIFFYSSDELKYKIMLVYYYFLSKKKKCI